MARYDPYEAERRLLVARVDRYTAAVPFMKHLKKAREFMTRQQYLTLRGQAISGDIEGAWKGFAKVMGQEVRTLD